MSLCKNVSQLIICADILNLKILAKHTITNEVIIYLNILRSGMKHRVGSNCQS